MTARILFSLFIFVTFFTACSSFKSVEPLNQKPAVIPALKEWQPKSGYFLLTSNTGIVASENIVSAMGFKEDLGLIGDKNFPLYKVGNQKGKNIIFTFAKDDTSLGNEGYSIDINDSVEIMANTDKGFFNATQTLLQILKQDPEHRKLPKGYIKDSPLVNERAFMIDVGRKFYSVPYLKKTIRDMAWYKLNVLHLHLSDWSGFRLQSDKFPSLASKESYSKQDIRELQDYAKKYQIMIVPEIDLPGHATHIIKWNRDLTFNCESMLNTTGNNWLPKHLSGAKTGWILDVTKPKVHEFVKQLLDEFIPLFDAPYFHIGGDEWQYDDQKLKCPELARAAKDKGYKYPGDLFVAWINEIDMQVKSYGKTTQIWSWWNYSPNANKQNVTSINPNKDIVVNVWNKETQETILADGFHVISTFEDGPGALYITPGAGGKVSGDYGYFDSKSIYESWSPVVNSQFNGYKVCMWADHAEHQSENWFNPFFEVPLAVFAEKTWGNKGSDSFLLFLERRNKIGAVPVK